MKLILSGEDEAKRAAREQSLLSHLQGQGRVIRRFNLGKDDPDQLLAQLGTQAMFAAPQVWAVGGLEKIRSPKQQAALIGALADSADDAVLSVHKDLGAGLKKIIDPKIWQVETFPLPKLVFAFCDGLKAKPYSEEHRLFRQIVEDGDEWWLQTQLARTMLALLQTKAGLTPGGAPFQVAKWQRQAKSWSLEEMQRFIRGLFELELAIKSGKTRLTWSQQFDILLASLYDELHSRKGDA
jgi:DNA polymerase III delta subunit